MGGEVQGHVAVLGHAGDEGRGADAVLSPARLDVEHVVEPQLHPGHHAGGISGVHGPLHGGGQLVKGDVVQRAAGADPLPEILEIRGFQQQGRVPWRGVHHVHIPCVLLHGDGQHTGVALPGGVKGGKAGHELPGGLSRLEGHVVQQALRTPEIVIGGGAGDAQLPHVAAGQLVETDMAGRGLPSADGEDLGVDLAGDGFGGPSVAVPQPQVGVQGGDHRAGGDQLLHLDGDVAGFRHRLAVQGPLGHCGDDQVVVVHALLVIDGGGQGVLAAAGHLDALVEPQAVDGILAGDVRAAQCQLDVTGGELGGGVPQGDGHGPPLRQAHPHLAVVEGPALLAHAVGVIKAGMGLRPYIGAIVPAHAGVGAVLVVGKDVIVVGFVHRRLNELGLSQGVAAGAGADVPLHSRLMAVGCLYHGHCTVAGLSADRAPGGYGPRRPRSGGQGHRHDQRQQGGQGSVDSLFHI